MDWAAHEDKVGAEYDARRAMLLARAGIAPTSRGGKVAPPSSLGIAGGGRAGHGGANAVASEQEMGHGGAAGSDPSSTPWRSREKQVRKVRPPGSYKFTPVLLLIILIPFQSTTGPVSRG